MTSTTVMKDLAGFIAGCHRDGVERADYGEWTIELAARGFNGIVYRARADDDDLAAKVSRLDDRDRVGREVDALETLGALGYTGVPKLVGAIREIEDMPVAVVLMGWRQGEPLAAPPAPGSSVWAHVVRALAEIHMLEPVGGSSLRDAVLGLSLDQVVEDMLRRTHGSSELVVRAAEGVPRSLPPARRSLIHCDANLRNVLVDHDGAVTVLDWENAGWGDPCFDVGDLLASPQLLALDAQRFEPLIELHAELLGDPQLADRSRAYARLMIAWWVVRLRRELHTPSPRLDGVQRMTEGALQDLLSAYEARAELLFGS